MASKPTKEQQRPSDHSWRPGVLHLLCWLRYGHIRKASKVSLSPFNVNHSPLKSYSFTHHSVLWGHPKEGVQSWNNQWGWPFPVLEALGLSWMTRFDHGDEGLSNPLLLPYSDQLFKPRFGTAKVRYTPQKFVRAWCLPRNLVSCRSWSILR